MRQRTDTLFRRHRNCELHEGDSYEADELRKWTPCQCTIYFRGRLRPQDLRIRRCTNRTTWEEAKAVVAAWKASESPPPIVARAPAPGAAKDPTFEAAGKAYQDAHERAGSSPSTRKKYRLLWAKMTEYATDKLGYTSLRQWKRSDVIDFLAWMGGAPKTYRTNWTNLKAAFEYCVGREWMPMNVARFKQIRNLQAREAAKVGQRFPYTDAELERMIYVCENVYDKRPVKWSRKVHARANAEPDYTQYKRKWTGKDLADFILLSVYTGLRISDVATFHIDRLQENGDVRIRARKNGTWVCTWVPPWLQQIIRERAMKHGPYVFGTHTTTDMDVITDVWRRKLKIMWRLCGEWTMPPTHHRLRHTFIRILLVRGVPIPMIAELAGDTEKMIRTNYSAWVPERQEQVRNVLQEAFAEVPKASNVVPISN